MICFNPVLHKSMISDTNENINIIVDIYENDVAEIHELKHLFSEYITERQDVVINLNKTNVIRNSMFFQNYYEQCTEPKNTFLMSEIFRTTQITEIFHNCLDIENFPQDLIIKGITLRDIVKFLYTNIVEFMLGLDGEKINLFGIAEYSVQLYLCHYFIINTSVVQIYLCKFVPFSNLVKLCSELGISDTQTFYNRSISYDIEQKRQKLIISLMNRVIDRSFLNYNVMVCHLNSPITQLPYLKQIQLIDIDPRNMPEILFFTDKALISEYSGEDISEDCATFFHPYSQGRKTIELRDFINRTLEINYVNNVFVPYYVKTFVLICVEKYNIYRSNKFTNLENLVLIKCGIVSDKENIKRELMEMFQSLKSITFLD